MTKGRPADPTRARRKTGNKPLPGEQKPANLPAPLPGEDAPVFAMPDTLPPEAQAMFQRVVDELAPRGLREADIEAITMMCHSAYVHQQAREFVRRNGVMVLVNGRPIVNPAIKVARDEAANYLRMASEYGLTLAARLRLGLMQLAGESMLASLSRDLDRPDVEVRVNV
jgi:P27 family predicted phage terminase small subunit